MQSDNQVRYCANRGTFPLSQQSNTYQSPWTIQLVSALVRNDDASASDKVRREALPLCGNQHLLVKNRSLYRRSLKLSLDWSVHRHVWRGQAVYIRSLFDANKSIQEPRKQMVRSLQLVTALSLQSYPAILPTGLS